MKYQNIRIEQEDHLICRIIIDRPHALNALNKHTLNEIHHCLTHLKKENRIVILEGAGEKSFIAGGDVKEMNGLDKDEFREFLSFGQKVTHILENGNFLSIAKVSGYALGGGFEMAIACDFLISSADSKFGFPEVSLGIIPGFGGNVRIASKLNMSRAKQLVLSGKIIDAHTANDWGLLTLITHKENLEEEMQVFINSISGNSFNAMINGKKLLNRLFYRSIDTLFHEEAEACATCFDHQDRKIGMSAFINKNKADFKL